MKESACSYRVLYADTDKMGYLYYGHYAKLYELARSEQIRSVGINYRDLEDVYGVMMPVAHLSCRYKKPAYYDDLLTIKTKIMREPGKIIHYQHKVYNQNEELLNIGEVKLFFVEMATKKSISCPDFLLLKFQTFF